MTEICYLVGKHIREERTRVGMHAKDLAAKLGVTPAYISLVESGSRNMNQKRADQVADALGIGRFCCSCGVALRLSADHATPVPAIDTQGETL